MTVGPAIRTSSAVARVYRVHSTDGRSEGPYGIRWWIIETLDTQRRYRALPLGERALRTFQRHRIVQAKWKLRLGEAYRDQSLIFASQKVFELPSCVGKSMDVRIAKRELRSTLSLWIGGEQQVQADSSII